MRKLFFGERAVKYIIRKRRRTVILFFVFFVICTLDLTMLNIKESVMEIQENIHRTIDSKVIADVKSVDDLIDICELEFTNKFKLKQMNKISIAYAFPSDFTNFKGEIEDDKREEMITLYGYDDLSLDSRFSELEMRLLEGEMLFPGSKKAVVINNKLAMENGLKLGDEISLTYEEREIKGKIIGIYKSSVEDRQPETMVSFYRIENIIYVSNDLITELTGRQEYNKIIFYLENPNEISSTQKCIDEHIGSKAVTSISDTMFHKIEMQLSQMNKITNVFLIGSIFLSVVIVTLLHCIWMRDRKKEIGIFLSLGYGKLTVLMQMLFESSILFLFSLLGSVLISYKITDKMITLFNKMQDSRISFDPNLNMNTMIKVLCISIALIVVSVLLSTMYLLVKKPREILADMEE